MSPQKMDGLPSEYCEKPGVGFSLCKFRFSDRRSDTFERRIILDQFSERLPAAAANFRSFPDCLNNFGRNRSSDSKEFRGLRPVDRQRILHDRSAMPGIFDMHREGSALNETQIFAWRVLKALRHDKRFI